MTEREITQRNEQFLTQLHLRLQCLHSADAMVGEAIKSIGEYLQVERVVWHDVDVSRDITTVTQDWCREAEIPSIVGTYQLSEYILPDFVQYYETGQPAIVSNVATYPYTAPFASSFLEQGVGAFLGVPCLYEGRWVAVLAIYAHCPQPWHSEQVALLQATVERLWSMIEQTKAIQALREMEKILKQKEEQFRLALELTQTGIWDWDLTTGEIDWNSCHYALLGYQPGDIESSYQVWRNCVHPDDLAKIEQHLSEALKTHTGYEAEYRVIHPDGSIHWMLGKGQAIYDEGGKPLRMIGTIVDITTRKETELALFEAQESLTIAIEAAQLGTWHLDLTQDVSHKRSLRHDQIFGYSTSQVEWGEAIARQHILPEDVAIFDAAFARARETGLLDFEVRVQWPDGSIHWMAARGHFYFDEQGNPVSGGGVNFDITERKKAQEALFISEQRFKAILDYSPALIFLLDHENRHILSNRRYTELINHPLEDIQGKSIYEFFPKEIADQFATCNRQVFEQEKIIEVEDIIPLKDGYHTYLTLKFPLYDQAGKVYAVCGISTDITERKKAEARIENLAYYDPLTGLPNRRFLLDRAESVLSLAHHSRYHGALLLIDLDRFKMLNDARGHAVGDILLQEVAARLKKVLRKADIVARFGGDEFVVLLPELSKSKTISAHLSLKIGQKICTELANYFQFDKEPISISASIGITLFPKASETVNDLLKEADTAMYQAKASGRNMARLFETKMQIEAESRFTLEAEIRHGFEQQQFQIYLQPQVDCEGGLVGAEALIRWHHPVKGVISPLVFIPVAEETGLIIQIGEWVLRETCRYLRRMQTLGVHLRLSVNVSPCQFRQETFIPQVKEIVRAARVDPTDLTLEVTEGLIIEDIHQAITTMSELQQLGIHFSIDDFGTGYSSLAYLKRLPLDELKIDQSFVQDIPENPNDVALVEAIISIARHFNLNIVAEGVETQEQARFLQERGCDFYQGYLYSKPVPMTGFDWTRQRF